MKVYYVTYANGYGWSSGDGCVGDSSYEKYYETFITCTSAKRAKEILLFAHPESKHIHIRFCGKA